MRHAIGITHHAVGVQRERFAAAHQQQVPAPLCGARGGGLHQQRVALRGQALQGQQVGGGGQRKRLEHDRTPEGRAACAGARYTKAAMMAARVGVHGTGGQTRLNTSVPLVPPKPKPLDITTSTLASRAVLGT